MTANAIRYWHSADFDTAGHVRALRSPSEAIVAAHFRQRTRALDRSPIAAIGERHYALRIRNTRPDRRPCPETPDTPSGDPSKLHCVFLSQGRIHLSWQRCTGSPLPPSTGLVVLRGERGERGEQPQLLPVSIPRAETRPPPRPCRLPMLVPSRTCSRRIVA